MGTFSFRKAQKLTRELRLLFPTLPFLISPTDDAPKQPRRGELIIESAVVELRLGVGKLSVLKSCVYCFLRWAPNKKPDFPLFVFPIRAVGSKYLFWGEDKQTNTS